MVVRNYELLAKVEVSAWNSLVRRGKHVWLFGSGTLEPSLITRAAWFAQGWLGNGLGERIKRTLMVVLNLRLAGGKGITSRKLRILATSI